MKVEASLDAWLDSTLPRLLPEFLPARRWFAGKARVIEAVGVDDAVWLPGAREPCALVVVTVAYADGARERYALLIAFVQEHRDLPVVGRVETSDAAFWAVEAATDADAFLPLLRGFDGAASHPTRRGGMLRYADVTPDARPALASARVVRWLGAEQSNTSLRIDRALVFKLFRKLDDGENPELEVGRFLSTRTTFRATPALHGSLTYTRPRGMPSTVGVLQGWIDNRGDGWSYVVEQLRQQAGGETRARLVQDVTALGAITADFHDALATDVTDPAFAPEPVTLADVRSWEAALGAQAARAFALVERNAGSWPDAARRLGESLLGRRETSLVRAPGLGAEVAPFRKIRVHGDYHLGQTLKTDEAFALIDFEGEPARPLAERRAKHAALKDVAGMIRSFDYAAETVRVSDSHASATASADDLRPAFLEGYLAQASRHRAVFLPDDRVAVDAWIDFFEVWKAFYELEYEISNRPAWVHIPLRGILRILKSAA